MWHPKQPFLWLVFVCAGQSMMLQNVRYNRALLEVPLLHESTCISEGVIVSGVSCNAMRPDDANECIV